MSALKKPDDSDRIVCLDGSGVVHYYVVLYVLVAAPLMWMMSKSGSGEGEIIELRDIPVVLPILLLYAVSMALFRFRIEVTDVWISKTRLGSRRTILWEDAESVRYCPGGHAGGASIPSMMILRGKDGSRISIPSSCKGFEEIESLAARFLNKKAGLDYVKERRSAEEKQTIVLPPLELVFESVVYLILLAASLWAVVVYMKAG